MIGERIKRARKAAGLSLAALGEQVGLSQMTLSKFENGKQTPSSTQIISLSKALGVRTEYFFRRQTVQLQNIEYRKRSNASKRLLDKIHADVLDKLERWQDLLSLYPKSPIKPFSVPDTFLPVTREDDIEKIADQMRDEWLLGRNPIPDMIDTLEANGILVILTDSDAEDKFDGLAGIVNGQPMVAVCGKWNGDRLRFTLAHELGHLVLEGRLSEEIDEEKACNRFAGAFLLPKDAVELSFGKKRNAIDIQELHLLKHEYGISMGAILYRLHNCKIISYTLFDEWQRIFSKNRWRKNEPGMRYPSEKTIFFKQLVYRGLAEAYFGESKAAELLSLSLTDFHDDRRLVKDNNSAAIHQ